MVHAFTNQHYSRTILTHRILAFAQLSLFFVYVLKLMKYFLKVLVAQICFVLSKDHHFSAFRPILAHELSVHVYHEAKSDLLLNVVMRKLLNYLDQGFVKSWVNVFDDATLCFALRPLSQPSILFPLSRSTLFRLQWSSFLHTTSILPSFWQSQDSFPSMLPF